MAYDLAYAALGAVVGRTEIDIDGDAGTLDVSSTGDGCLGYRHRSGACDRGGCRRASCPAGMLTNLVYLWACSDCDVALANGGSLQAGIARGNITYLDLATMCPFENSEIRLLLEGRYIRELLETTHVTKAIDYHDCEDADPQICATDGTCDADSCALHGHYPQWAGLRWAYNPRDDTVLSVEVFDRVDGYWAALDDDKEYVTRGGQCE